MYWYSISLPNSCQGGVRVSEHNGAGRAEVRQRLQLAFERSGLTQAELAERCRAAKGTVSDWFNPEKDAVPDGEKMARLPAALRVSGHWLLTGDGPVVPDRDGDAFQAPRSSASTRAPFSGCVARSAASLATCSIGTAGYTSAAGGSPRGR